MGVAESLGAVNPFSREGKQGCRVIMGLFPFQQTRHAPNPTGCAVFNLEGKRSRDRRVGGRVPASFDQE